MRTHTPSTSTHSLKESSCFVRETAPPYAGGTDFLCPPFHCSGAPVSAGFCVFPCGRGGSDSPGSCPQETNFSLFSLLACGRVHKVGLVFIRVPGPSGAQRRQHQHLCAKRSNVLCCKLVEQRAQRREYVHERGNCRPVTVVGQCSNFAKQAPTNLVGKVRCR